MSSFFFVCMVHYYRVCMFVAVPKIKQRARM